MHMAPEHSQAQGLFTVQTSISFIAVQLFCLPQKFSAKCFTPSWGGSLSRAGVAKSQPEGQNWNLGNPHLHDRAHTVLAHHRTTYLQIETTWHSGQLQLHRNQDTIPTGTQCHRCSWQESCIILLSGNDVLWHIATVSVSHGGTTFPVRSGHNFACCCSRGSLVHHHSSYKSHI